MTEGDQVKIGDDESELKRLEDEAAAKRDKIIKKANRAIEDANRQYAKEMSHINWYRIKRAELESQSGVG